MKEYVFKTIFLGNTGVGKSSILSRKKSNVFDPDCRSTIGIDFVSLEKMVDDVNIKIHVWDTAGQDKYENIVQSYYREIAGAFLVYNVNDKKSIESINNWIDRIKYFSPDCEIVIVGNQADLNQTIKLDGIDDIPNQLTCSAKTGFGINAVFDCMIDVLCKKISSPNFNLIKSQGISIYEEFNFTEENHNLNLNFKKNYKCCNLL